MIRDVLDIEVYKESLRFLQLLYLFLRKLPKSEFDTVSQLKRAGKSIPANIAEGFAKRKSEAEFWKQKILPKTTKFYLNG